jgi:hypothetical protein
MPVNVAQCFLQTGSQASLTAFDGCGWGSLFRGKPAAASAWRPSSRAVVEQLIICTVHKAAATKQQTPAWRVMELSCHTASKVEGPCSLNMQVKVSQHQCVCECARHLLHYACNLCLLQTFTLQPLLLRSLNPRCEVQCVTKPYPGNPLLVELSSA